MIDSVVLSVISFVGDLEPEVTFVIVIPVTKARLISLNLTHLSSNPYNIHVFVIDLDFSKVFDYACHSSSASKLSNGDISNGICNWLIMFLYGRSFVTR